MAIAALKDTNTFNDFFNKINEVIAKTNNIDNLSSTIDEIVQNAQAAGQIGEFISTGLASDYDSNTTNTVVHMNGTGTINGPEENTPFNLYVAAIENGYITQIAVSSVSSNTKMYIRSRTTVGASWSKWLRMISAEEAAETYFRISGGTFTGDIEVNGSLIVRDETTIKDKFSAKNEVRITSNNKDIILSNADSYGVISLTADNDSGGQAELDIATIDYTEKTFNINGLAERANWLTDEGLSHLYIQDDKTYAASAKAVHDLYQYTREQYPTKESAHFTGIASFDEAIDVSSVIRSTDSMQLRVDPNLEVISRYTTPSVYLDVDIRRLDDGPHVLGTRQRTGVTNYNMGNVVYETSCIELDESFAKIRLRKTNTTTLEEESDNIYLTFNKSEIVPSDDNKIALGSATFKYSELYASTDSINTSDRNLKDEINYIDSNLIENWGNVQWVSFKYKDSIEEKGSNARVHTGLIAQDLRNTLDDFEIDASKYGFFCYDKWDDQYDVQHITVTDTDESGNETISQKEVKTLKKPAGEQYSLRYQEIQAIENAYLRNEIKKLNEKIEELSRLINS